MNGKLFLILVSLGFGMFGIYQAMAQSTSTAPGEWEMVAGNGGDGGTAWKVNVETGASFFCYRQNCFRSQYPSR